jgi:hypothetical protein
MKKLFLIFLIVFCISCGSFSIPDNPVYVTIINHTGEEISVTNLFFSVQVGMIRTTAVEKGSRVSVNGVTSGRSYGSRVFYFDSEWEIR